MEIYRDASRGAEERAADLLDRMELPEKIAQLHALWLVLLADGRHAPREDRFAGGAGPGALDAALEHGLGQVTRPLGTRAIEPAEGVRALNALQRRLVEGTRLGIPVLAHEECLSGLMVRGATIFPSALGYGASWDPDLIERVGRAIGDECVSAGCRMGLAPVLDVARDARWGRTEECFAEDPYLTGLMACAYLRGLQGPSRRMLATLKHFAGHSASEGGRNHAPVHMGPRELADEFLLPFEMAVRLADAGGVMPAYHDIDGEPLHASRRLLTGVLRGEWGFDGIVVADYAGVGHLHEHHGVSDGPAASAALAWGAGLDVELPGGDCAASLNEALSRGLVDMETLDAAVLRVLTAKLRLGLFERPYADDGAIALRTEGAVALAREAAARSVTVLSNDGTLPLARGTRVAVIGPAADDPLALLGDYTFPVHLVGQDGGEGAERVVTILQGMRAALGGGVSHARGCHIIEERGPGAPVFPGDVDEADGAAIPSPLSTDRSLIAPAAETARAADVALLCLGDLSGIFQTGTVGEGSDVDSIELPGVQQELLDAVLATGTPTVVLLTSGRPYRLGGREGDLAAYVMAYFPGEQGGHAIAEVLTGAREPEGRLTVSVPRSAGAGPYHYAHRFKSAGTPVARHWGTEFPFGHGLSYTAFSISGAELEARSVPADGTIRLSVTVRNEGTRPGVAVPQLYARDLVASLVRPLRELKGFARVPLGPGGAARVTFELPTDMLSFTGPEGRRIVEPGEFELMVGESSGRIDERVRVELTGAVRAVEGRWRMTSAATVSPL